MAPTPSFSLAIETANLSRAELDDLWPCLDSLAEQDPAPATAAEVILMNAGGVPSDVVDRIRAKYPWVTVRHLDGVSDYADIKAQAASVTTGDILLMCDMDCRYQPGWLAAMLAPFAASDEVHIVAGETSTEITGAYGLALALTWIFPRFTNGSRPEVATMYLGNNVAFRRDLLLDVPRETGLPVVCGANVVHSMKATLAGYTILRQPAARALHRLPLSGQAVSRHFWLGHDVATVAKLASGPSGRYAAGVGTDRAGVNFVQKLAGRVRSVLAEDPRRLIGLPLALPLTAVFAACYMAGVLRGHLRPAVVPQLVAPGRVSEPERI